ncbi:MAG: hypothetical protein DDG59_00625 [Anaerolineae bacterium]|nr:MAG: hypothetical protein DDG59_00625 [Anaerolineae bacterium]
MNKLDEILSILHQNANPQNVAWMARFGINPMGFAPNWKAQSPPTTESDRGRPTDDKFRL